MASSDIVDAIIVMIKGFEGCHLKAYPDPIWNKIKRTPENWAKWGKPWTIGYGETKGITEGMVWTQEYAEEVLRKRVIYFLVNVYKHCPQLFLEPDDRAVACTSLAYNIGIGAFSASSVCRRTKETLYALAAKAFLLWNKAGGFVMRGLTIRRQLESKRYERAQ